MLQAGGAAAYLDGDVVVAGGTTWIGDVKTWLSDVQIYNPASNTWRFGPKLPAPMAYGPFVSSTSRARNLRRIGRTDGSARIVEAERSKDEVGSNRIDSG